MIAMTTGEMQPPDSGIFSQILPFDPFDPAFQADPYPAYRKMLESGPVAATVPGVLVVGGHREVSAVLRDPRFGHGDGSLVASQITKDVDGNVVRPFIFMDPPDHTRIRSLVSKAFTARNIERLRPRARRLMAELIDAARAAAPEGPIDIMSSVAYPIATTLIREMLGAPAEDHDRIARWSAALSRGLDPDFLLTPEEIEHRDTSRLEFEAYFSELADRRRVEPADDLVTELVRAEAEGDSLTKPELVAACRVMLAAGYVATANLIGNAILALLRNPEQLAWLRANPDRVDAVVEEALRYDSPVQLPGTRLALEDAEIAGHPVKQGEVVVLLLGAANHDPAAYDEPERFDASRTAAPHLAFSGGVHFCLGAPLARLTAQVALSDLAEREFELAEPTPPYAPNFVIRSLLRLPLYVRG
jgi:unspecific monooxygenase